MYYDKNIIGVCNNILRKTQEVGSVDSNVLLRTKPLDNKLVVGEVPSKVYKVHDVLLMTDYEKLTTNIGLVTKVVSNTDNDTLIIQKMGEDGLTPLGYSLSVTKFNTIVAYNGNVMCSIVHNSEFLEANYGMFVTTKQFVNSEIPLAIGEFVKTYHNTLLSPDSSKLYVLGNTDIAKIKVVINIVILADSSAQTVEVKHAIDR